MLLTSRHYYSKKHKRSVDTYCRFESFSAAKNMRYNTLSYQSYSRTATAFATSPNHFREFVLYESRIKKRLQNHYRSETK